MSLMEYFSLLMIMQDHILSTKMLVSTRERKNKSIRSSNLITIENRSSDQAIINKPNFF